MTAPLSETSEVTGPGQTAWYLVHTKVRQEMVALHNLERQGYPCYLPQLKVEKRWHGRVQWVTEPLFPRYLFIRLGSGLGARGWGPIRSTIGVSRLVTFGHAPPRISDEVVAAIQHDLAHEPAQRRCFAAGDAVQIMEGPFKGLEAVYDMADGQARALVLIQMLHQTVRLSIGIQSIDPKP